MVPVASSRSSVAAGSALCRGSRRSHASADLRPTRPSRRDTADGVHHRPTPLALPRGAAAVSETASRIRERTHNSASRAARHPRQGRAESASYCIRPLVPQGLARLAQNASRLQPEVEAKGFVDLFHDVGWNSSDPRTNALHGYRPNLFCLCLGVAAQSTSSSTPSERVDPDPHSDDRRWRRNAHHMRCSIRRRPPPARGTQPGHARPDAADAMAATTAAVWAY